MQAFIKFISGLVLMSAFTSTANSEVIPKGNTEFAFEEYYVEGKIEGCGFRFNSLNSESILISGAFGIHYIEAGGGPTGVFKLLAKKLLQSNGQLLKEDLLVNHGWLRTGSGTSLKEFKSGNPPGKSSFILVSKDIENFTKVLIESMDVNLKIGFNQKPNTYDSIYEIIEPPSNEVASKVNKCLREFLDYHIANTENSTAAKTLPPPTKIIPRFMGDMFVMDPFIAKLRGDGGERFLEMTVSFKLSSPEAATELNEKFQTITNSILFLVREKTFNDVNTPQGKLTLKDEIAAQVNDFLKEGHVLETYFTEFIIQ